MVALLLILLGVLNAIVVAEPLKNVQDVFAWVPKRCSIQPVSKSPVVCLVHNILSAKECDEIIQLARPRMERSTVDLFQVSDYRTSYSATFLKEEFPVVRKIEKRVARMVNVPRSSLEQLQVVRYQDGQQFKPHYDYFDERLLKEFGSQRIITFLIYLNDVDPTLGGQTVFPELDILVQPKKGTALFWYNMLPNGKMDPRTLHGGKPLKSGEKWAINVWIREIR